MDQDQLDTLFLEFCAEQGIEIYQATPDELIEMTMPEYDWKPAYA